MRTAFCVLQKCEVFEIKPQECTLKDLCLGLAVLYLEKVMLGALLLFYHLADTFIQRVHLLQGPPPWRSLGLSVLPKCAIMIIHELLLVRFKPTTFYLSAYNRSATFWLLSFLLSFWFEQFTNGWRALYNVLLLFVTCHVCVESYEIVYFIPEIQFFPQILLFYFFTSFQ